MKKITMSTSGEYHDLCIETPGCTVVLHVGYHDDIGRRVTAVEIKPRHPDDDGRMWMLKWFAVGTTLVARAIRCAN